jgi:hypothetical protein
MITDELKAACIRSYSGTLNYGMALDINKVSGQDRVDLMKDTAFLIETRAIYAQTYADRIAAIEQFMADLGTVTGDDKVNKDVLASRLKLMDMKNDIIKEERALASDNEDSTINIVFEALTREDFERRENIEVHGGKE